MILIDKLPLFLRPPFPLLRRIFRWTTLLGVLFAIEVVYVFIVTAGTFDEWPTYNALYETLEHGFRKGHLYLPIEPSPELVAKEDPLDPANSSLWIPDLSLYKGRYYMYWGPAPTLALWAVKATFKIKKSLGDQFPCLAFYTIYAIAGAMLLQRMARRLFPGLPHYLVLVAILAFAFASPTPFLLATPGIYEAAIGGCQAFLLLGLVFAFDAIAGFRRRAGARLLVAGLAWSFAIGCRVSAGPAVLFLALLTAAVPRGRGRRLAGFCIDLAWLCTPIALTVLALLAYNKARFDSWFEFGTNLQLNTMHFRASADYIGPNLYSYFLRAPVVTCEFPFVKAPWDFNEMAFPPDYDIPSGYSVQEPVVGMLRVVPWSWLLPLGLLIAVAGVLPRGKRGPSPAPVTARGARFWCPAAFAVLAAITALPFVAIFGATIRYLGDVTAGFMLFATWGAWAVHHHIRRRRWLRRAYGALLVALAASTIVLGLLFGFQGYGGHFQLYNPPMYEKVVARFSLCSR